MSNLVMCLHRHGVKQTVNEIKNEDILFIDRAYVDGEDVDKYRQYPQVIPLVIIVNTKKEILTYKRQGSETRLHTKRSLTLGGHVDIGDFYVGNCDFRGCITCAAEREVYEEGDLVVNLIPDMFMDVINTQDDDVSKVHVGYPLLYVTDKFQPKEETSDYEWMTFERVNELVDEFELWSQIIITDRLNK